MNVGIIGASGIAKKHLTVFNTIGEVASVSVADTSIEALDGAKRQFPAIAVITDYRTILQDAAIEMVDICLPHHLHRQVAFEALDAGKHVFCEKPIAITLGDAYAMDQRAKEKNLKLCILLNQMFTPAHRKAKEMIDNGDPSMTHRSMRH